MRILSRLLIVAALGWLMAVLFWEARDHQARESSDPTNTFLYFGGVVLTGLAIGAIVAFSFLPAIGDWVGRFFVGPNEKVEKDLHADAMSKLAQGDFSGAVEEYRKAFEKNPSDSHALCEMSRIYCEHLGSPEAGASVLESGLEREWPSDDSALLCNRLADVYINQFNDPLRARALLVQVAESMSETKHAANALHRIHEIDRSLG